MRCRDRRGAARSPLLSSSYLAHALPTPRVAATQPQGARARRHRCAASAADAPTAARALAEERWRAIRVATLAAYGRAETPRQGGYMYYTRGYAPRAACSRLAVNVDRGPRANYNEAGGGAGHGGPRLVTMLCRDA